MPPKRGQCFGSGKGEMGIWLLREAACVSLDVQNSSHVGTRGQGTWQPLCPPAYLDHQECRLPVPGQTPA